MANFKNKCNMCGMCCKLFLINLSEEEYFSGKYIKVFEWFEINKDFDFVRENGINILAKKEDGSCIYLEDKLCKIHSDRPQVCKEFFCSSKNKRFENMRQAIKKHRVRKRLVIF
jgi:Fe-S-cluster containining protein